MGKINNRDEKIQGGISQIQEQLDKLSDERYSLVNHIVSSNCRLKTPDMQSDVNIKTLSEEDLLYYKAKLLSIQNAVDDEIYVSGFPISTWVEDIDYIYRSMKINKEINRLNKIKDALSNYYSEDKKISDSIDNLLSSI